jgi:hypothetical protein
VLFLTPDEEHMRVVNETGGMGETVDLGNLSTVLDKLSVTRPFLS